MRGKISVFSSQSKALRDCIYNKISVTQKHLKYKHTHKLRVTYPQEKKDWKERHQLIKLLFLWVGIVCALYVYPFFFVLICVFHIFSRIMYCLCNQKSIEFFKEMESAFKMKNPSTEHSGSQPRDVGLTGMKASQRTELWNVCHSLSKAAAGPWPGLGGGGLRGLLIGPFRSRGLHI